MNKIPQRLLNELSQYEIKETEVALVMAGIEAYKMGLHDMFFYIPECYISHDDFHSYKRLNEDNMSRCHEFISKERNRATYLNQQIVHSCITEDMHATDKNSDQKKLKLKQELVQCELTIYKAILNIAKIQLQIAKLYEKILVNPRDLYSFLSAKIDETVNAMQTEQLVFNVVHPTS